MIYDITHTTTYRFASPVQFGPHRLLFRPRDSHDVRVLATALEISPLEQRVNLVQDVYGNSVALIVPAESGNELSFVSRFTVEHTGTRSFEMPAGSAADAYPPAYSNAERLALQPYLLPSFEDTDNKVADWARGFFTGNGSAVQLRPVLATMTQDIKNTFVYSARDAEGIQPPVETLQFNSGSCRDFATLMIEGLRHMGVAARFVSGYIHTPQTDHGATHAWLQAYIPECGWVPFDPTNNLTGGHDLIRVAVSRDGKEVPPLSGSWTGEPGQFIGMEVDVRVTPRDFVEPMMSAPMPQDPPPMHNGFVADDQGVSNQGGNNQGGNNAQMGGQYGGQPGGQFSGQSGGQSNGQSNGQSSGQSNGQSGGQSQLNTVNTAATTYAPAAPDAPVVNQMQDNLADQPA